MNILVVDSAKLASDISNNKEEEKLRLRFIEKMYGLASEVVKKSSNKDIIKELMEVLKQKD